jgi:hypothetical protein
MAGHDWTVIMQGKNVVSTLTRCSNTTSVLSNGINETQQHANKFQTSLQNESTCSLKCKYASCSVDEVGGTSGTNGREEESVQIITNSVELSTAREATGCAATR